MHWHFGRPIKFGDSGLFCSLAYALDVQDKIDIQMCPGAELVVCESCICSIAHKGMGQHSDWILCDNVNLLADAEKSSFVFEFKGC